jgi:hypothetical protein
MPQLRVEHRGHDQHLSEVAPAGVRQDGVAELVASCRLIRDHQEPEGAAVIMAGVPVVPLVGVRSPQQ